jgi:anaerobic magnesium-protoporphyrin IX monomethyl ester cyclase
MDRMHVHLVRAKSARPINRFYPNLGIATIASVIRKASHEVQIHDLSTRDYKGYIDRVKSIKPDVIGFTSLIDDFSDTLSIIEMCKEASPSSKIVVGGPHASLLKEEVLGLARAVDSVVCGEGEKEIIPILERLMKDSGGRMSNPAVNVAGNDYDLNLSPFPSWDIYNLSRLFPILPVETSRGCPYSCKYCAEGTIYGKNVRYKDVARVIDEIKRNVEEFGVRFYRFADSTLNFSKNRLIELCQAFIANKLDIRWGAYARFENIDEDSIKLAKDAGCESLYFGVESGDPEMLRMIRKTKASREDMQKIQRAANAAQIHTHCNFMIGLPDETEKTLDATLELIRRLRPNSAFLSTFFVVPLTEMHTYAQKYGIEFTEKGWIGKLHETFKRPDFTYFRHRTMTQDDMRRHYCRLRAEIEQLDETYWNLKDYPLLTWLSVGGTKEGLKRIWKNPESYLNSNEIKHFETFKEKDVYDISSHSWQDMKDAITALARKFR